jgi:hypothetical protein
MFAKIREKIKGWKTIIWARSLILVGVLIAVLSALTGDQVAALVPDKFKPFAPLLLVVIGLITEGLRRVTTGPVGAKASD